MKKILITTNLLTLGVLLFFILRDSFQHEKQKPCSYPLDSFDFHYKKEVANPNIVMLGNSLIRHESWDSLLHRSDIINRGISGDDLRCICERLNYLKGTSIKICFIEGGINDLPAKNTDSLFRYYTRIVEFWQSQKVIPVINLVTYISPKAGINYPYRKDYKAINLLVRDLNNKIRKFAVSKNIEFIDLNKVLCDEHQLLLREEFTVDGIHLTKAAYKIWAAEINVILDKFKIV